MNEGKSKPEKGEPFPYHELEFLPSPSLRSIIALQDAVNLKRKLTPAQKKSLVLSLRAMLPSIAKRREIAEKNVKIFQRFEEQLNCRSQREIKDANRLLKIAENLLLLDVDITANYATNEISFKTEVIPKEEDGNESDEVESVTTEHSCRKREHTSISSSENPPKRYPLREIHSSNPVPTPTPSISLHDHPDTTNDMSISMRSPMHIKDNSDLLSCSVFWKEVECYYCCFSQFLINMIMSDSTSVVNSPFHHLSSTDQAVFTPMDCLLSCLIPETPCREVLQSIEKPSKRIKKLGDDDMIVTAASRRELANLTPSIVNELYSFGLIDDSLFFPEVQTGSIAEEIIKLNKELEECIQENHLYCRSFRDRFKEELKRDMLIREDEQRLREVISHVQYLRSLYLCFL